MDSSTKLKKIGSLKAVKHFLIMDRTGSIDSHNFPNPGNIASMILKCSKNWEFAGKDNFQYQFFSYGVNAFLIFPVGNQYLGVVKGREISTRVLAKSILKFLKD